MTEFYTIGLLNPRIIEPSDYWDITVSIIQ